jgi:cadmium resistance protein CadD (predicted permease)
MGHLFDTAILALVAFVATNVDDLVSLSAQMAVADRRRHRRIAEGQMAATLLIIGLCALVGSGLASVPHRLLGFLGFIPIGLGIRSGVLLIRQNRDDRTVPAAAGFVTALLVTLALSADNVAVYLPILATDGLSNGIVAVVVWVLADVGLLAASGWIGRHPNIRKPIERIGPVALPAVFVMIGVVVIIRSGLFTF